MLEVRPSEFARACKRVAAVSIVVVLAAACSGGSDKAASPTGGSSETGTATRRTQLLAIGSTIVQRTGERGMVSRRTKREVLASAQRYVDRAILSPLETGKLGKGYPLLFVSGLRPVATGADARVLTDAAVGKTATFTERATPVVLSALADNSGALLYLATKFNVNVNAKAASGAITITRSVELTYVRVGRAWLVSAYRVNVTRTRPAGGTASAAS